MRNPAERLLPWSFLEQRKVVPILGHHVAIDHFRYHEIQDVPDSEGLLDYVLADLPGAFRELAMFGCVRG